MYEQIEKEEGFKFSEGWIYGVVYDLYIKTKRSFYTTDHIFKMQMPNCYLETLPLLRSILEAYLHSTYIRLHKNNKELIEKEYQEHLLYRQWKIGSTLEEFKRESSGDIHPDYQEFISNFFTGKPKPRGVKHLDNIKELSKKVKQFELYVEVYTTISSFVHYSPIVRNVYGQNIGEMFIFNKFEYDEKLDIRIRKYLINFALGVIRNTALFLEMMDFIRDKFIQVEADWRQIEKLI